MKEIDENQNGIMNETKKEFVKNVCENTGKIWKKNCPKCGKEQYYSNKYILHTSLIKNTLCINCRNISKERNQKISLTLTGKKHSKETKRKMSLSKIGYIPWNKGKHCSDETKKKISIATTNYRTGKHIPDDVKLKISQSNKGKIRTNETRKNMRISKCERFKKLGISAREDKNARYWFRKYNKENNLKFKQNWYCEDLGYYADGYDKNKHIWCEYDTPYHKQLYRKRKDLIRQNNIIKHFESIDKPLNQFIRVDTTQNNKITTVYAKS